MMWGGFGWGWMMVIGMLMMVLFWAAIIALVIWGVRALSRGTTTGHPAQPGPLPPRGRALDILQERYARGEITLEQYEEMRKRLES